MPKYLAESIKWHSFLHMFLRNHSAPPGSHRALRMLCGLGAVVIADQQPLFQGMKTRPEECVSFDEADLWLVRWHAR